MVHSTWADEGDTMSTSRRNSIGASAGGATAATHSHRNLCSQQSLDLEVHCEIEF